MDKKQEQKLNEVYEFMQSLKSAHSIPLSIDQAFRTRFPNTPLRTSGKGASSENVSINEGGAANHTVMDNPDGFLQVQLGATTYFLPYFT
jgi:hypothetical protein